MPMSLLHARPVPVSTLQRDTTPSSTRLVYNLPSSLVHPARSPGRPAATAANRNPNSSPLTEHEQPAMPNPIDDRDPATSPWHIHTSGSQVHAQGHSRMQGTAVITRSDSSNTLSIVPPTTTALSQPWETAPAEAYGLATANSTLSSAPRASDAVGQQYPGPVPAFGGTTSDQQPATRPAAATARTRIFDPARDLNPTHPLDQAVSPTSHASSSPRSAISRNNLSQADQPMGLLLSAYLPGSSTSSSVGRRQDPSSEMQSRYQLDIIEHPVCARASTYGDRDRRVINPPPILKLSLKDYNHEDPEDLRQLTWPYNIVTCTLWRISSVDAPLDDWIEVTEYTGRDSRRQGGLMGTLVANPFIVESPNTNYDDESNGPPTCFYIFSDLSCRTTGLYRLRFGLTKIGDDFYKQVGARAPTIAYAWTEPFEVYSAKDFPGVRASSRLLRYLKLKGANVTIKKEKEGASSDLARKRARAPTSTETSSPSTSNAEVKRSRALVDAQLGDREVMPLGTGYPDQNGPDD